MVWKKWGSRDMTETRAHKRRSDPANGVGECETLNHAGVAGDVRRTVEILSKNPGRGSDTARRAGTSHGLLTSRTAIPQGSEE